MALDPDLVSVALVVGVLVLAIAAAVLCDAISRDG